MSIKINGYFSLFGLDCILTQIQYIDGLKNFKYLPSLNQKQLIRALKYLKSIMKTYLN